MQLTIETDIQSAHALRRAHSRTKKSTRRRTKTPLKADVMWVGISMKPLKESLDDSTATGRVVTTIERRLHGHTFHRTNLVKFSPLDNAGRLRLPAAKEIEHGLKVLHSEIDHVRPRVVIALGAIVSKTMIAATEDPSRFDGVGKRIRYRSYAFRGISLVPVHHPSYILIYKRQRLQDYIAQLTKIIREVLRPFEYSKRVQPVGILA